MKFVETNQMKQTTIGYLQRYIDQLNQVTSQDQVHGQLADWHFATRPELAAAMQDLNASLGLQGAYQLRPHIATTAIGRLDREIVVVSANPGYSDRPVAGNPGKQSKNAMEDAYRSASKEQNAGFCRHFFGRYREVAGGSSPYWTRVMGFLEVYRLGHVPAVRPASRELWRNTAQAGVLGGLDLLPFHSTSDAITPHLHGARAEPKLRDVAVATLAMALRLKPKMILVSSGPGQQLMSELMSQADVNGPLGQFAIESCPVNEEAAPYDRLRAWKVDGGATLVVTFPYQIFSGSFNAQRSKYTHTGFVKALRKLKEQC